MKTIFNKQKRSVAGVLIALTALTTALTGCQEDFELDLPLAVSARELSLTKDAGSTHVLVYFWNGRTLYTAAVCCNGRTPSVS